MQPAGYLRDLQASTGAPSALTRKPRSRYDLPAFQSQRAPTVRAPLPGVRSTMQAEPQAADRERVDDAPDTVADVVVIGGGGSGLAAAIEATTLGRHVIVLEKNPAIGGSTIRSIGSIAASCTPHQIRKGIQDNPDDHFEDAC